MYKKIFYFTKRSLSEEHIDGSQDSVCSSSLFAEENHVAILPEDVFDFLGDTDGFSQELLEPSGSLPL